MKVFPTTEAVTVQIVSCPRCKKVDVQVYNPEYSSFNVGKVTCLECGYSVRVEGLSTDLEFIKYWNDERKRLAMRREELLQQLALLDSLLKD